MKKKFCVPRMLKNIAYVLFPVLLIILLLLVICLTYPLEKSAIKQGLNYFETNTFAEDYANEILSGLYAADNLKEDSFHSAYGYYINNVESIEGNGEIKEITYCSAYSESNVIWLIIDNKTKMAYTNLKYSLETSNLNGIKNKIAQNQKYWNYENNKINTNIKKLNNENISYINSSFDQNESEISDQDNKNSESSNKKNEYTIYTSVLDDLEYIDNIYINNILYNTISTINQKALFLIPVLIIIIIGLIPLIINGVGRTSKSKEISLNWYDKILIEIAALIAFLIGTIGFCFLFAITRTSTMAEFILAISIVSVGLLITYLACIMFFETMVKRIKTHTFVKTTFAYWVYSKTKRFLDEIKINYKFILYFVIFILANIICFGIMWSDGFIGIILSIVLYTLTYRLLNKRIKSYLKIKGAIHNLYNGNTEIEIDKMEVCREMQDTANEINNIAGGLSNALEEKLKSERLKTELITNVSHDIKTPLTSIINYVDLLKKENIEGEKAKEYLQILDSKSQRLKKLTEDLVEASKASSGAIKLNMEKLNVNELIKQVSGEFEDKFKLHNLQEIITFPEEEVYINADSRYMYRVLENMYSNISKYAMEQTRVYTDIVIKDSKISIQIKNVSKQKLNITTEELMQRFVRGEASRNTEGSGLGLSIARSLTELQQGSFDIYLDGDLFKVIIEFQKAN